MLRCKFKWSAFSTLYEIVSDKRYMNPRLGELARGSQKVRFAQPNTHLSMSSIG